VTQAVIVELLDTHLWPSKCSTALPTKNCSNKYKGAL